MGAKLVQAERKSKFTCVFLRRRLISSTSGLKLTILCDMIARYV